MRFSYFFKKQGKGPAVLAEIGASMVEMGLLIALIALIAMPAVKEVGWKNTCNMLAADGLIRSAQHKQTIDGTAVYLGSRCSFEVEDHAGAEFFYKFICELPADHPWVEELKDTCL